MNKSVAEAGTARPRRLPPGQHPGQAKLKSQPGIYRCALHPEIRKRDPKHADYRGILHLENAKCSVLLWIHADNSLGLRLQKIKEGSK
jgi:hypothetical protein